MFKFVIDHHDCHAHAPSSSGEVRDKRAPARVMLGMIGKVGGETEEAVIYLLGTVISANK
jgi:hypothetical protein